MAAVKDAGHLAALVVVVIAIAPVAVAVVAENVVVMMLSADPTLKCT